MTERGNQFSIKARIISAAIILFVAFAPIVYAFKDLTWENFKFDLFTIGVPICYFTVVISIVLSVFGVKGPEIISENAINKFQSKYTLSTKSSLTIFGALFLFYGFSYLWLLYKYLMINIFLYQTIIILITSIIFLLIARNKNLINIIENIPERIQRNKWVKFLNKQL